MFSHVALAEDKAEVIRLAVFDGPLTVV